MSSHFHTSCICRSDESESVCLSTCVDSLIPPLASWPVLVQGEGSLSSFTRGAHPRCHPASGEKVSEEAVDKVIETGEAENLFQKAFMEQVHIKSEAGHPPLSDDRILIHTTGS